MFISERLRAAVFYTGGQARAGESEACVCVCVCVRARVCNEVAWSEAQRQPSAGYSPSSFGGQSFTKKISLRLSSSGARPCW